MNSAKKDRRAIIRTLTARRVFNYFGLRLSFNAARLTKKARIWGQPFSISIEPTTSCNLRCPECPSGLRSFSRDTGNIRFETGRNVIDQLHRTVGYINFYFQGEPFISPHFLDLVSYARSKNIYTSTSTNAHFLNSDTCHKVVDSGLNRVIISIDGTTQDIYEQYRRSGTLSKVIEGAKNLVKVREERGEGPYIIFQFLVVRPNEHQVEDVKRLASEIGVDEVKLKTAQVYDYENGNELIPTKEEYSRYVKGADGKFRLKGKQSNHCWRMWQGCVFTWDGDVVPCCFDKDAKYKMGNINSSAFRSIWHSQEYRGFRSGILTGRDKIDICKNCSEGTKVWN